MYAFGSVCEQHVEDVMPIISLAKGREECADEDEQQLWLRNAAPSADSSSFLREEFQIVNSIDNTYLERNKRLARNVAHRRKIMYHVHSSYLDKEQVMTHLALKYAF